MGSHLLFLFFLALSTTQVTPLTLAAAPLCLQNPHAESELRSQPPSTEAPGQWGALLSLPPAWAVMGELLSKAVSG